MGGSCLQQRAEGYPAYVFHEPLHSLTQSYSHAHSAAAAAHSQPHRGIPTSHGGTPATPGGQPAGPGGAPYQPTTSTATGKFSSLEPNVVGRTERGNCSAGTRRGISHVFVRIMIDADACLLLETASALRLIAAVPVRIPRSAFRLFHQHRFNLATYEHASCPSRIISPRWHRETPYKIMLLIEF